MKFKTIKTIKGGQAKEVQVMVRFTVTWNVTVMAEETFSSRDDILVKKRETFETRGEAEDFKDALIYCAQVLNMDEAILDVSIKED